MLNEHDEKVLLAPLCVALCSRRRRAVICCCCPMAATWGTVVSTTRALLAVAHATPSSHRVVEAHVPVFGSGSQDSWLGPSSSKILEEGVEV
jgi:hypothetical protein